MECSVSVPKACEISKHFLFGIGFGLGVGIVIRKVVSDKAKHADALIRTLQRLIREVQSLRECLEISKRDNKEHNKPGNVSTTSRGKDDAKEMSDSDDNDDDLFEMALTDTESESFSVGRTRPVDDLLEEIRKLQQGDEDDKEIAYNILSNHWKQFQGNCEVMWRYASALCDHATLKGKDKKKEEQQASLKQGVEAGGKAIIIDDTDAAAHKWFAILLGSYSEFQPTQDKILMGYKFKEHIEKSIKLKNDDPAAYTLLGRWCYEVYILPWYMRKAAATLYASPPSATVDEALENFLKAEKLNPGFWKTNTMFIGKCYYQKSCYKEAKEWLLIGRDLPSKSDEDRRSHEEIQELLRKL